MTANALFVTEKFIKETMAVQDNLSGKFLLPAIREAQDIDLQGIIGTTLYATLDALVVSGEIYDAANAPYRDLLDVARYYIAYLAVANVIPKVSYKVGNFGLAKSTDENLQVASASEVDKAAAYYRSKADRYCLDLQNFVLNHFSDYPELKEGDLHRIHSNLYSAAGCGIFLGGPRGKFIIRKEARR